ncbi:MAG: helix-turn-helix domain-containing protein [Gemmatimonadaceae bacterium]|jgi:hypothetical protein
MTAPTPPADTAVLQRASTCAHHWTTEAEHRRSYSKVDPVADTLEACARQLLHSLDDASMQEVSTTEYARIHGRSVQTVRRWCALGQITARRDGRDYLIRRGEPAPTFTKRAS